MDQLLLVAPQPWRRRADGPAVTTRLVAIASGIIGGVSMIGLTIRILMIILFLARCDVRDVIYAVMVSTVVTTVAGSWLAYGEPPNLIMNANLYPHLNDAFFLLYCAPLAFASYVVVVLSLRRRFRHRLVHVEELDVLDVHAADVRFLQATRHGEGAHGDRARRESHRSRW